MPIADMQIDESTGMTSRGTGYREPAAAVMLRGVSKSYMRGGLVTRIIDNVDLTVKRGECLFLLGPSGSGKTTLLSIIGCVLSPDNGLVCIMGNKVSGISKDDSAALRRVHIGFVFQRFHLIRGLTAIENVALPLTLNGWTTVDSARRASDLLAIVDMTNMADVQPHRLSVGQCQRVALARALAADPDLILADEPTASLDAKAGQRTMQLLRHLTVDLGKTVIVVTHDTRILSFSDRILHMKNGKLEEGDRDGDVIGFVEHRISIGRSGH